MGKKNDISTDKYIHGELYDGWPDDREGKLEDQDRDRMIEIAGVIITVVIIAAGLLVSWAITQGGNHGA
jgi:hypothetical protein